MQLVPVLHRAGDAALPLLPDDRQHAFGVEQFHKWPTARDRNRPSGAAGAISAKNFSSAGARSCASSITI
jgi:hypothetical protein